MTIFPWPNATHTSEIRHRFPIGTGGETPPEAHPFLREDISEAKQKTPNMT